MSAVQKLSKGFRGAAIASTLALASAALPAFANDSPKQQAPATTVAMTTTTPPVVQTNQITRKEAFRASTNQIVYHVGEGIVGVEADVSGLRSLGYNVSAHMGGKSGQVECWVARRPCGKYSQSEIFDGTMSGIASLAYDVKFGEPQKSEQLVSLDR